MAAIMAEPTATAFTYGYSNKRWASFAEPAIQNLVKVNVPIYQVQGTEDDSTPIEDAYVVPIEFARLKKNNLTFKVFPNCDHSLIEHAGNKEINHWDEMLRSFFSWVEKTP
jgi:pimeloyl-ACP methyl ester carboxylesterase